MGFFHILYEVYIYEQVVVIIENLSRNWKLN